MGVMKYEQFGNLLTGLRQRAGIKQVDFAAMVESTQQTVSRWELGTSRPRSKDMARIAAALNADVDELLTAAGYLTAPMVAASFDKSFPLHALSSESFELFCTDFLERLYRAQSGKVFRAGKQGHTQRGIDITVEVNSAIHVFQCKRVAEFGPAKVRAAMAAAIDPAEKKVLLLSITASPQAREVVKGAPWEIWDQDDISRQVRGLAKLDQIALVDRFFRGQRFALLGEDEAGPWESVKKFFEPYMQDGAFGHAWQLVGRETETKALREALESNSVALTLLIGAGGAGKSRLLRDVLEAYEKEHQSIRVRMLTPQLQMSAKSLEDLGQGDKLLVVDDAHDREDLALLLRYVAVPSNRCRLLLSLRPYGLDSIRRQAAVLSLTGPHVVSVSMVAPKLEEAISLAEQVLRHEDGPIHMAKTIASLTHESPLFTVLAAHVVARDKLHPQLIGSTDEFKHRIYLEFEKVVTSDIAAGLDVDRLKSMLSVIALVQPIARDDKALTELFEQVADVPLQHAARLLNLLIDAGLLFKRGRTYRLSPDLLADAIIERSCVTSSWQSTGYAEQVFDKAGSIYLKNLLINLGRLDWRKLEGDTRESRLLAGIWAKLQRTSKYADPHMEAAVEVAYYQPRQALDFVKRLIADGHETDSSTCQIIKHAAYNASYVEECCALLWTIGRKDGRSLNQHPHHPIRILKELATPEPNKPVELIQRVVDFGLDLIKRPLRSDDTHTPFEILEGALESEGHVTTATRRQFSFSPYAVDLDVMSPVREQILTTLLTCITQYKDKRAFDAAAKLSQALRRPHGLFGMAIDESVLNAWDDAASKTLAQIYRCVTDSVSTISPVVLFRVVHAIGWHAFHGPIERREVPLKLVELLSVDLKTRCIRALMDAWGTDTWELDTDSCERPSFESDVASLIEELKAEYQQPSELCEFLAECLHEIDQYAGGSYGQAHIFLGRLLSANLDLARHVASLRRNQPGHRLSSMSGTALGMVMRASPEEGRTHVDELLDEGGVESLREIAEAYVRFDSVGIYTEFDKRALHEVFQSTDHQVLWYAGHVVREVARHDPGLAIELISNVDLDSAPQMTHDFYMWLSNKNVIPFESISDSAFDRLLGKLKVLKSLDDYWVEAFLRKAMQRDPQRVLDLIRARLQLALERDNWHYRPLNLGLSNEGSLGLLSVENGPAMLVSFLSWGLGHIDDYQFAYEFGHAVEGLCAPYDEVFGSILLQWMKSGSMAHAHVVAAVIQHAPNNFVIRSGDLVDQILRQAELIEADALKIISGAIYTSTFSGARSTSPGEPYKEDLEMKAYAEKKLAQMSRAEPAYEVYENLLRDAEQGIARQLKEKTTIAEEEADS